MSVPSKPSAAARTVGGEQVGGPERLRRLHADQAGGGGSSRAVREPGHRDDRECAAVLLGRGDHLAPQRGGGERPGRVVDGDDVELAGLDVVGQGLEGPPLRLVPGGAALDHPEVVLPEVGGDRLGDLVPFARGVRRARSGASPATSSTVRTDRTRIGTPCTGSSTLLVAAPTRVPEPAASSTAAVRGALTRAAPVGPAGRGRRRRARRAPAAACGPRRGRGSAPLPGRARRSGGRARAG